MTTNGQKRRELLLLGRELGPGGPWSVAKEDVYDRTKWGKRRRCATVGLVA